MDLFHAGSLVRCRVRCCERRLVEEGIYRKISIPGRCGPRESDQFLSVHDSVGDLGLGLTVSVPLDVAIPSSTAIGADRLHFGLRVLLRSGERFLPRRGSRHPDCALRLVLRLSNHLLIGFCAAEILLVVSSKSHGLHLEWVPAGHLLWSLAVLGIGRDVFDLRHRLPNGRVCVFPPL